MRVGRAAASLGAAAALLTLLAARPAVAQTGSDPGRHPIDRALNRLYNFDFAGAHAILDGHLKSDPGDPLGYSLRAGAFLFEEFDRLKILESEFFSDDDKVTDKKKFKPDPRVRDKIFAVTAEARKRAKERLASKPSELNALFAICMASGIETEYLILVEKRYLRSYTQSRETQSYARKLLAMSPPFYDAYVTIGSVEYVVANLNFFFRLFARFDGIQGSKQAAIDNLKKVVDHGRFYPAYAKILLAVIHLREKRPEGALALLKELQRDYPENKLFLNEVARLSKKVGAGGKAGADAR